jgi:heavy metal translocating P-type ATPase
MASDLSKPGCTLCGGAVPEPAPVAGYCCEGCARVSEILDASGFRGDRRGSAAFLEAARAGLVPADRPAAVPQPAAGAVGRSGDSRDACLGLEGLWCPSCAWLVEAVLEKTPGVSSARVTFFADLAEVKFDPTVIGEKDLAARVEELGYKVRREGEAPDRGPLLRFGVAAFLQMNVMWLSYALYAHEKSEALEQVAGALPWVLALLSAPVVFGAGAPMFVRAWKALRARALVMDSLIALAAGSAWVYSLVAALRGSHDVYFDGACGLITFRLLGRLIEQAAFRSAAKAGQAVRRLLPRKARRLGPDGPAWVPADALGVGDRFRVAPGERVPLDGRVVAGTGRVSTAVVDGEPRPRAVAPGSEIPGGSVCGEAALDLVVTAPAAASLLSRVADHVARASGRRGPAPELADSIARVFIPSVLVLSAVTFGAWVLHGLGASSAFERALSVLVVSCPCALGIAAPLARVIAAGRLARRGVIVRVDGALDELAEARVVAFDKTGTLTRGRPSLAELAVSGATYAEALGALAALEERAGHPIAQAVRDAVPCGAPAPAVSELRAEPGRGITGLLDGAPAWAGRAGWVTALAGAPPAPLAEAVRREEQEGRTAILFAWGGGRWAALSFGDALREEAADTVAALHGLGLETTILTGDGEGAAGAVARRVGVTRVVAGCVPDEKARLLEELRERTGARALFVGDGINDAPGLASSVGVAVATGTDFARETADVLLLEPGLGQVPDLVLASRRMRTVIRQNLAWAGLYNAVLIPLAAAGRLTPVWAAAAMVASGLLVVANSLRLQGGAEPARRARPEVELRLAPAGAGAPQR